ncbi:hypothetical protein M9Y10_045862 [Tritrichomonas musculus]|uniref:RING-type domain-containing protein n=1 Tax=Tritrichomonas musculus TaxID=1915356 RepID=A0ABR2JWE9_9EUKA
MGSDQSSPKPDRKNSGKQLIPPELKTTHNLYSHYRWSKQQINNLIENGIVSPMYPPSETPDGDKVFCAICYSYYQKVNLTGCCNHQICSECLAAVVDPPPAHRVCPFCKKEDFQIIPFISSTNGGKNNDGDDPEFLDFQEKQRQGLADVHIDPNRNGNQCSEKARAIAQQYNLNPFDVDVYLNAGIPEEEIIANLSAQ